MPLGYQRAEGDGRERIGFNRPEPADLEAGEDIIEKMLIHISFGIWLVLEGTAVELCLGGDPSVHDVDREPRDVVQMS